MAVPVHLTFRDIPHSPSITAHVERRAAKLETFHDGILRCDVVVGAPHRHHEHGQRYHVRIDVRVPGKELIVSKIQDAMREDLHAAVDDAFSDAERVLEEHSRRIQNARQRSAPPRGVITKIFHDRGYGFIQAESGEEIYFHRSSVLGASFEKLTIGTKVRYAEEDGDKGPQASTVHVID